MGGVEEGEEATGAQRATAAPEKIRLKNIIAWINMACNMEGLNLMQRYNGEGGRGNLLFVNFFTYDKPPAEGDGRNDPPYGRQKAPCGGIERSNFIQK